MIFKKVNTLSKDQLKQVVEVYKLTSTSKSEKVKEKYFDYYLDNFPELFIVAFENEKALGYVCGSNSTLNNLDFFKMHSYLDLFKNELEYFPAHLHINVHPDAQGMGIGKKLIRFFENLLAAKGVHIITTPKSSNVKFYEAMGYKYAKKLCFNLNDLLFLGKELNKP